MYFYNTAKLKFLTTMKGNSFLKSIKILAILVLAGLSANFAQAQTRSISGTVVDSQNVPVIGASVMVVGQNNVGTITDLDGKFSLNVPAGSSISVSFIGYETQVVAVGNQSVFNIVLKEDSEFLEETVVIGYGVQRKSDLTGAVASVKESDLANRSAISPVQALQGKAAGVQIINSSGAPGANSSVQIRGFSSNSKTTPLMIVDGLKVSDINYLDPDNIASIEVLKDAASAAIYGIEAGNGVILVTTKSGQNSGGNSRIFYNFQNTTEQLARVPEIMNVEEYLLYQDLLNMPSRSFWDGVTNTDWVAHMFTKGHTQRHTLGAQGSSNNGNMYISLSYLNSDGIIIGPQDTQKRLTGQINGEYKFNKWLTIGTNNSLEYSILSSVSEGSLTSVLGSTIAHDPITPWTYTEATMPADVKALIANGYAYPTDEYGNYLGKSPHAGTIEHPLLYRDATDGTTKSFNLRGTTYVNITPLKGLVFTSRFGYRAGYAQSHTYYKLYQISAALKQDMHITERGSNELFYQWENFANYNTNIGKHSLNVMAGFSYQENNSDFVSGTAYVLTNDAPNYRYLSYSVNDAKMTMSGVPSRLSNMSYYGRLGWTYDNRYMVQVNFRADAYDTSKLAPTNRWGYFPSISAGWTISNEPWFAGVKDALGLSFMKLRASWGINGNVNALGSYQYASVLAASNQNGYNFTDDSGRTVGVCSTIASGSGWFISYNTILPNPNIKWETARQIDFGLDLRFFQERLTLTADWYNKNTHDLITSVSPPANTGASSMYVNAGMVNNHGLELELGWKDNIGDFSYGIDANLATLHNKVMEGLSTSRIGEQMVGGESVAFFEAGYPLWYLRLYDIESIDQQTGDPVYAQHDTNPALNDDDRIYAGKPFPDFTYGATINLGWKGFDFIIYGAGSQGLQRLLAYTRQDQISNNQLKEFIADAWTSPSSTGYKHPKPQNSNTILASVDRLYDASFFKIKQIQLGYTLPRRICNYAKLSTVRAYVSFDDWFTFTKYPGIDPELSGFSRSSSGLAVDSGSYPISKKLVFGLNIAF